MNKSISAVLASAKIRLTSVLNSIISESELPSQLYESVLLEMMLELKQQRIAELIAENTQLHNRINDLEQGEANEKSQG